MVKHMYILAATIDEVFRSTQDNFKESPDSSRMMALGMVVVAAALLLLIFHQRHKRDTTPRVLNHPGKLLREVTARLPLRKAEMKQLKALAEQEECSSPLVLLLCPSLLARGIRARAAHGDRKALGRLAKKLISM